MNFRNNWGYEINLNAGRAKEEDTVFTGYGATFSSWFNISPAWNANVWGGFDKSYNFGRDYLAINQWLGASFGVNLSKNLSIGSNFNMWVENNPDGNIEEITYNARPNLNLIPFNNLNMQIYVDNVFTRTSDKLQNVIGGLLVSYNFAPKSWIYFAINEVKSREEIFENEKLISNKMRTTDRASVFKIKYLLYL